MTDLQKSELASIVSALWQQTDRLHRLAHELHRDDPEGEAHQILSILANRIHESTDEAATLLSQP